MDAKEFIQRQIASARRQTDAAMKDTTDEQFNWTPPGTANPIKVTLLHVFATEDSYIQSTILGKQRVWDAEGWSEKIGLSVPPGRGGGWDEARQKLLTPAAVLAYGQAVRAATDAYLSGLTAEELDRQVSFMGGQRPVADVLAQFISHTAVHAGDIAALKGVQGVKGLPF